MVYTGIIVTEAEMEFMSGANVDAGGDTEANHNLLAGYAEAYLSSLLRYDIATNWAGLNAVYKPLFSEWAARFCAIALIKYDMSGYTSRVEAEDMINVHWAQMKKIERVIAQMTTQDFMGV